MVETPDERAETVLETSTRRLRVSAPFDLARTAAPAWWARGRWPNVDWHDGTFIWVGWDGELLAWRSARQVDAEGLEISGTRNRDLDTSWAAAVLGTAASMPTFQDPVLASLARTHAGLRPWSAGSLFEGVVSSIVGQSISVAAAATTERRLYERLNQGIRIGDRLFWPPPLPRQLAASSAELVRGSGVTTKRAEALVAVGALFAKDAESGPPDADSNARPDAERLLAISGIGPWTVQSALLWGLGAADAHPTGDVALLRAAQRHYAELENLKDLDRQSEQWKPVRGWAARLLWLDLLGFDRGLASDAATRNATRHIP